MFLLIVSAVFVFGFLLSAGSQFAKVGDDSGLLLVVATVIMILISAAQTPRRDRRQ